MTKNLDQPTLAIFANFFIDNDERLKRMKDSFLSFKNVHPNEWVINIRGSFKYEAGNFLKKELGDQISLFYLKSSQGWLYDSRIITHKIDSNYILFWIEDHILVDTPANLKNCIVEMSKLNVDQLSYSFLTREAKNMFSIIEPYKLGSYIKVQRLDAEACLKIRKLFSEFYIISCVSIMHKKFFRKVLLSPKPYLKRWPLDVPFDFEKKSKDKVAKVIWHAIPNNELFAPIDDDTSEPGYSLISRGLYPNRVSRSSLKYIEFGYSDKKRQKLKDMVPKIIRPLALFIFHYVRSVYYTINYLIKNW